MLLIFDLFFIIVISFKAVGIKLYLINSKSDLFLGTCFYLCPVIGNNLLFSFWFCLSVFKNTFFCSGFDHSIFLNIVLCEKCVVGLGTIQIMLGHFH